MLKHFIQLTFIILCVSINTHFCVAQNLIDAEEYVVYSDLLRNTYGDNTKSQFAIEKTTHSEILEGIKVKYVAKKLSLNAEIIKDFNERNNLESGIQNQFNLKAKVNLIGDEIKEVLKPWERDFGSLEDKNWEAFRLKYQTFSLLSLSRVGFNKKRDKALVVLGSQYGWTAGDGFFYLLVKKRDGWKIKKKVRAWIS